MYEIKQKSDENVVRERLTKWLESNRAKVYWGENPQGYDHKTFEVKSESIDSWGEPLHRPDLLASFDDHTTIIEIKPGTQYGNIADGVWETFDYWKKYETDRLVYKTDEGNFSPDSFTFATRYSPFGHIYTSNHEFFYSNGEITGVNDRLPQHEANMSGVTIRAMWRFAQSVVDNTQVGIGFLLSDFIESIPNFAKEIDEYSMVRANKVEKTGNPAIFHWAGDQDWVTL
jgi:hypothetical protein